MPQSHSLPSLPDIPRPVKVYQSSFLPELDNTMIHHKDPIPQRRIILSKSFTRNPSSYGVSKARRILSPQVLFKRHDRIREALECCVGLTVAQREVVFRLLRYWAYYGKVYPKQAVVSADPGCSKATFWRTIRVLKDMGLIRVVNRFIIRPHAQISNLYRLDRLVLLIARYLAEHGQRFFEKWLRPFLVMSGSDFWSSFRGGSPGPGGPVVNYT